MNRLIKLLIGIAYFYTLFHLLGIVTAFLGLPIFLALIFLVILVASYFLVNKTEKYFKVKKYETPNSTKDIIIKISIGLTYGFILYRLLVKLNTLIIGTIIYPLAAMLSLVLPIIVVVLCIILVRKTEEYFAA